MKSKANSNLCAFKFVSCWELVILIIFLFAFSGIVVHNMNKNAKLMVDKAEEENMCGTSDLNHFRNGSVDFRGFDNAWGSRGCYVIPDIVHLIKFNQDELSFIEMICVASVLTNHKPKALHIHTNVLQFKGRYWSALQSLPGFHRVRVVRLSQPRSIFGRAFGRFRDWHASDVARLQLLAQHGGIYLDADVYVTGSLHGYRRYEFVVEWNDGMNLGNQVLMAHKDARITPLWLETYKQYKASQWYYNGGVLPTQAVLSQRPELFHRVKDKFGTDTEMLRYLYEVKDWNWTAYPALHLFVRHQGFHFDENSTLMFRDSPIRQMILKLLPDFLYPTRTDLNEP